MVVTTLVAVSTLVAVRTRGGQRLGQQWLHLEEVVEARAAPAERIVGRHESAKRQRFRVNNVFTVPAVVNME